MPSGQEYGNRLRNDVRRALSQHLAKLEEELKGFQENFSSSLGRIRQSLEPVLNLEVPTAESVIQEVVDDAARWRKRETAFLAEFAQLLRQKEAQEDILHSLLDGAHHYAPRVALFVAHSEQFVGWSSRGYSQVLAQQLSQFSLSHSESPLLRQAIGGNSATSADDVSREERLSKIIGNEAAAPWHAFTLNILRRPLAVLLVASVPERGCDVESLSIVMTLTGLSIENLALKILQDMSAAPAAGGEEAAVAPSVKPGGVSGRYPGRGPAVAAKTVEPEPMKTGTATLGGGAAVEAPHVSSVSSTKSSAAAASAAAEAAEAVSHAARETVRPPSESVVERSYTPMEVVRELSEEEKAHSEAKRFARLLVQEIKLYNEQKVAEGRKNKDIYVRLKRDIDRSRDMYEKRVSPIVTHKVDYFHDELIRLLGDNDPATLGSDYPGPRVES